MALTLNEAHALQAGTLLTFGSQHIFEVLSVEAFKNGVQIALKRDDGYLTHADQHMLHKAVLVQAPTQAPAVDSTPAPEWTDVTESMTDDEKVAFAQTVSALVAKSAKPTTKPHKSTKPSTSQSRKRK